MRVQEGEQVAPSRVRGLKPAAFDYMDGVGVSHPHGCVD